MTERDAPSDQEEGAMPPEENITENTENSSPENSTTEKPTENSEKSEEKPLGEAGEKALRENRAELKAAKAELAKYRKAEQEKADADRTESEKRAAAEKRAEEAELRATRLEVASDKGLTAAQAKYLSGGTREELEANAEEILKDFPVKPAEPRNPRSDPSQGSRGESQKRPTDLGGAVLAHYKI